eukprot:scaffold263444_cov60-Attheya_sp.AAC.1
MDVSPTESLESKAKIHYKGSSRHENLLHGHPDFVHIGDQIADLLSSPEESQVVVIGQGNVALDCARILAKGAPGLVDTDISAHALPILKME